MQMNGTNPKTLVSAGSAPSGSEYDRCGTVYHKISASAIYEKTATRVAVFYIRIGNFATYAAENHTLIFLTSAKLNSVA